MNYLKQLMDLMEFVKGQKCSLEELKQMVKEKNSNATIYTNGKLTFLDVNGGRAIINKSKYDNKWYVL